MSLQSTLKRLAKAVPVILASLPTVISVVKDVKNAIRKPRPPAGGGESQDERPASQPTG
jgi:hypothetical protein